MAKPSGFSGKRPERDLCLKSNAVETIFMDAPLIIFHSNCLDGFGSAYAAYVHFNLQQQQEAEFLPAAHGDMPPSAVGRTVYLLDYAYKRPQMESLCAEAEKVIVLDHHVTAVTQLSGLDHQFSNLLLHLDMDRSGAMMAWQYFHQSPAPKLIECIQDRDLWRWKIPESMDLNTGLMSHPFDFDRWHQWAHHEEDFQRLVSEGAAINRFRRQMIEQNKRSVVMGNIAGFTVPIVNCPRAIVSELLGELADGHPFAAGYMDKGQRRSWSLRSTKDGEDVAKIAELFGGGGHPTAAGFSSVIDDQDHFNLSEPG